MDLTSIVICTIDERSTLGQYTRAILTSEVLFVEDSGTEVERRPLVPKVPGWNPVMSGFCLWDFSTQKARVLVMFPGSRHRS